MKKMVIFITFSLVSALVNAQSWTELGGTVPGIRLKTNSWIKSITSNASGDIYAAGYFFDTNGYYYVAKWDGTKWSVLGGTVPGIALNANGHINTIHLDMFGNLYAGGAFYDDIWKEYVAKWNGKNWIELGGTVPGIALEERYIYEINSINSDKSGNIYAGGLFANNYSSYVAKWNGDKWSELGDTFLLDPYTFSEEYINSICLDESGNLYVGSTNCSTFKWNGTSWSKLPYVPSYLGGSINSLICDASGNLYAGGNFEDSNGKYYVAKWDGNTWSELGGTVPGIALNANGGINSIISDKYGNIYAAGNFKNANGYYYVAKWDGKKWSELEGTMPGIALNANGRINSIISDTSGNIYAAGEFTDQNGYNYVAKFEVPSQPSGIISGNISSQNILLYPNPSSGNLNINVTEPGLIYVYNSLGAAVIVQTIESGRTTISLENSPKGIYTIVISGQDSQYYSPTKIIYE